MNNTSLTLTDMTEDLHNDVLIWIKVRMETLILLGDIRDEIPVATVKTKIAILARHIVFGFAFSVIFALLMADVIGLFGAAAIGFFIGFRTHTNKAYINQDILNKTRTGIIKDKETTSLLIGQVKALKGRIIVPLAESLQRIHLESINDLAKDSLTSSLLKDVDKITKLRPWLEYELKEVNFI